MMIRLLKTLTAVAMVLMAAAAARAAEDPFTHGYADSNGVKIHYATMGSGPLVVMIHGFPDYWYTWRAADGRARGSVPGRGDRSARL